VKTNKPLSFPMSEPSGGVMLVPTLRLRRAYWVDSIAIGMTDCMCYQLVIKTHKVVLSLSDND
jgi:hypothetical protein